MRPDNNITSDIYQVIRKGCFETVQNNDRETLSSLLTFIRQVIHLSLDKSSIIDFKEYIFLLNLIYKHASSKLLNDSISDYMTNYCATMIPMHLRECIWIDIGYKSELSSSNPEKLKEVNQFYYWAFYAFSDLLYYNLKINNINSFERAINEFTQIPTPSYKNVYDIKYQIFDLQRDESKDSIKKLELLEEQLSIYNAFETYRRHVLQGIKFWIFFLYDKKIIEEQELLDRLLNQQNLTRKETMLSLKDILELRKSRTTHLYFGWGQWDFIERPTGKVYSPPNPTDWLTFGFFIDAVRLKVEFTHSKIPSGFNKDDIRFLADKLEEYHNKILKEFEKWKKLLDVDSREDYQLVSGKIIAPINTLKGHAINQLDAEIADEKLSLEKIKEFKEVQLQAWKSQNRIRRIFEKHNAIKTITDEDIVLRKIGFYKFLERAKIMFIEKHYSKIYGMEAFGSNIARQEDTEFFNTIIENTQNVKRGKTAEHLISEGIKQLKALKQNPTVIIIPPEFTYIEPELLENDNFESTPLSPNDNNPVPFLIGKFSGIPIYTSLSNLLKGHVLVCNFAEAFSMVARKSPEWENGYLKISISEVDDGLAQRKLNENPEKWIYTEDGAEISQKEAITKVKTSVLLEEETRLAFNILNRNAIFWGRIEGRSPNTERASTSTLS